MTNNLSVGFTPIFDKISSVDISQIYSIEINCYSSPWSLENFISELTNPSSYNWCIKNLHDNIILAYLFSYIVDDQMFITNICVHPNYRNQKIGSFLLTSTISKIKESNVKKIFLEVRENNLIALKMYISNGFIIDCIRKKFYGNGDNAILLHFDVS